MDKPKHTPGPWKAIVLDGETYVNPHRDDGEYALICKMTPASGPRADANARLISAAPELLVMLQRFYAATYGESSLEKLSALDFEQARNAIRRATGEE